MEFEFDTPPANIGRKSRKQKLSRPKTSIGCEHPSSNGVLKGIFQIGVINQLFSACSYSLQESEDCLAVARCIHFGL